MFKKLTISLFVGCAFLSGFGQITYDNTDFANQGDVYSIASKYYLPSDNVTISEFENNWDFSDLLFDSIDTVRFVSPALTQFADSFPSANLCNIQPDGSLVYLNKTADFVQLLGAASDIAEVGFPFVYSLEDDFMLARFPLNYGDEDVNTTTFTITESPESLGINMDSLGFPIGVDSMRINVTLSDVSAVDTFGTVKLPQGNFESLREDRMEIFEMSLDVLIFTLWIPVPEYSISDTSHIHRFLAKVYGYPIAEISVAPDNTVLSVSYIYEEPVSTNETLTTDNILIYPNPAQNILHLKLPFTNKSQVISIYNLMGNLIMTTEYNTSNQTIIISDLSPGNYFLSMMSESHKKIAKAYFSVIK